MSSVDPTELMEQLEKAGHQNLRPNHIWQACSQIGDWPAKQLAFEEILEAIGSKNALQHENYCACDLTFCEFSTRNFTAVQQYHEPMPFGKGNPVRYL